MEELTPTDEHLARTVAGRDGSASDWRAAQQACAELYQRHARKLLAFLAARVGRSDLEDLHQAVWRRVWQHLPDGFRGGNFRAWLYQIARNHLIDHRRKKRPEPVSGRDLPESSGADGGDDPVEQQERLEVLRRCLERLDPTAAALVRGRLAGESYEEICARVGLKAERAHKLFHQAKAQLQTCVQRALG